MKRHLRPLIMINDLESIDEEGREQLSDQPNRQDSNCQEEEKAEDFSIVGSQDINSSEPRGSSEQEESKDI